jgi:hypothetical protein
VVVTGVCRGLSGLRGPPAGHGRAAGPCL